MVLVLEMDDGMKQQALRAALAERTDDLMALPGVEGVALGLCDDLPCIKVFVSKGSPGLEQAIRNLLTGHQVTIEQTGGFQASTRENP